MGKWDSRVAMLADLDRDWAAACEWFRTTQASVMEIADLLDCDPQTLRETATDEDLALVQKFARVAFWETFKRCLDRSLEDVDG